MKTDIPRIVIAGTNSGCGKTTVSCAIMQAFCRRGLKVGAFKCGPDYIDPMFHSRIIGAKSANLDSFFFSENTLRFLLSQNGADRDISVIEGVMGYYDGMGISSSRASTYEVARVTDSPVVLVIGAKGAAMSTLAILKGFLSFLPENRICGVIFNQCTAMTYGMLKPAVSETFGGAVRPLGYLPPVPECSIESRHLGLVTAAEITDLRQKLNLLAEQAERSIDLDGLLALAKSASPVVCEPVSLPKLSEPVRIACAMDRAFCFYYADSLNALRELGAEIVPFSPLTDRTLPENIHGLYLGGGYPELYAAQLSENVSMRSAIREALHRGLPCIAECGGFMYLTERIGEHSMVGFLPGTCYNTGKLTRFGYVRLTAQKDNLLCRAGESVAAHEFHHWDCEQPGQDFSAEKPSGRSWRCAVATDRLYAGYPHFHFYANPAFAVRFCNACIEEKHKS